MQKPSIPKGTRDFLPEQMIRRKYILQNIEDVYVKYGFLPIETPAMEKTSTLTGKYGDEGDKLLFRILNSGDFLSGSSEEERNDSRTLLSSISEKGLRYDLTVPLARFVVQHRNDIQFPFRRYQIQPVWRADRPQKGRYREFWQCDADIIGSDSISNEADLVGIYSEVFNRLGLNEYILKINHRKLLEAVAEGIGMKDRFGELTIAIDKYDKVGFEGVSGELKRSEVPDEVIQKLEPFLAGRPMNSESINWWEEQLPDTDAARKGIKDLRNLLEYLDALKVEANIMLDGTLARGLDYYTGCIFEAVIPESGIGSVSGGGRYDDLTGVFGMPGTSGVGISFGIDRIYDIMLDRKLFGEVSTNSSKIIFCHFDGNSKVQCMKVASKLRSNGIACEVFPDEKKIGKQFDYANKRGFRWVGVVGDNEIQNDEIALKDMASGEQKTYSTSELIDLLK